MAQNPQRLQRPFQNLLPSLVEGRCMARQLSLSQTAWRAKKMWNVVGRHDTPQYRDRRDSNSKRSRHGAASTWLVKSRVEHSGREPLFQDRHTSGNTQCGKRPRAGHQNQNLEGKFQESEREIKSAMFAWRKWIYLLAPAAEKNYWNTRMQEAGQTCRAVDS